MGPIKVLEKPNIKQIKAVDNSRVVSVIRRDAIITPTKEEIEKINYVYNLYGRTLKLPENSVIHFEGEGCIENGIVVGNNSVIIASGKIFSNVDVQGTWNCPGNVAWWTTGCKITETSAGACHVTPDDRLDKSIEIQSALNSSFRELIFPPVVLYIGTTLILTKEKRLIFQGTRLRQPFTDYQPTIKNTSILFTDKNITLLRIAVKDGVTEYQNNTVCIEGGNFDVSLCDNYNSNCIELLTNNNEKVWGIDINTNIRGKYNLTTGVGININPIENRNSSGYVTQIRINSNISDFGIGIKANNYMNYNTRQYYNWCTYLLIDGSIINCPRAIETNVEDTDIRAFIQSGYYYNTERNGHAVVLYTGERASICSAIFDLLAQKCGHWSNQYAIEIERDNAVVVAYGTFKSALNSWRGNEIVNGKILQ